MVPYLVGFHPRDSLVLIGMSGARVVVTVRCDLADADPERHPSEISSAHLGPHGLLGTRPAAACADDVLSGAVEALLRAGASEAVAAIYRDGCAGISAPVADGDAYLGAEDLPCNELALSARDALMRRDIEVLDALLVSDGRWWSYPGRAAGCPCCAAGAALQGQQSVAAATATFAGLVALPDRADVVASLQPYPGAPRERLLPALDRYEDLAARATYQDARARYRRSVTRAIFAAARDADLTLMPLASVTGADAAADELIARYAIGLGEIAVRDSVWLAIDQGRLDGRALWHHLARSLPDAYAAAPLFLYGWASWRAGNGSLAGIAAQRALACDPRYSAAQLLLTTIRAGLDPFRTPRLRLPRG